MLSKITNLIIVVIMLILLLWAIDSFGGPIPQDRCRDLQDITEFVAMAKLGGLTKQEVLEEIERLPIDKKSRHVTSDFFHELNWVYSYKITVSPRDLAEARAMACQFREDSKNLRKSIIK